MLRKTLPLDSDELRRVSENLSARENSSSGVVFSDLNRMVSTLLEHYRQVLILFYLQEKSYEEVSDMLDLPLGTVKTYLHRARKELARLVEEEQTRAKRKTESYHGVPKV